MTETMTKKIEKIDRSVAKELRGVIEEAVGEALKERGLQVKMGNARYTDTSINYKMEIIVEPSEEGGIVMDEKAIAFKNHASLYDLKPEWLGRSFKYQRGDRKIVGLNMRARKAPIIVDSNGDRYRMTAEFVKLMMMSQEG